MQDREARGYRGPVQSRRQQSASTRCQGQKRAAPSSKGRTKILRLLGRTSLCCSSLGNHTQESASGSDCNNALGPGRETSRQGTAQSPMRQAAESISQKRCSEVNNESGAENSSRISMREQRSRCGEQLQDMGGWWQHTPCWTTVISAFLHCRLLGRLVLGGDCGLAIAVQLL